MFKTVCGRGLTTLPMGGMEEAAYQQLSPIGHSSFICMAEAFKIQPNDTQYEVHIPCPSYVSKHKNRIAMIHMQVQGRQSWSGCSGHAQTNFWDFPRFFERQHAWKYACLLATS